MMHDKPIWETAMRFLLILALLVARMKALLAFPFPVLMGEAQGRHEVGWDIELAPIDEERQ
jgi:hypothetical protein